MDIKGERDSSRFRSDIPQVHEAVARFRISVLAREEALKHADARTVNKHTRDYIAAFAELRAIGDEGREALAELMSDPQREVRIVAACYLLRYATKKAIAVLEAEAGGKGLITVSAVKSLESWRDGTWDLDPA